MPYERYVPGGVCPFHCTDKRKKIDQVVWESHVHCGRVEWLPLARKHDGGSQSLFWLSVAELLFALRAWIGRRPGMKVARSWHGKAIKSRTPANLYLFSSSLLHTYLVPNSPAQDLGASVWKACIAQRGVDPRSIVLRGHRGRNF